MRFLKLPLPRALFISVIALFAPVSSSAETASRARAIDIKNVALDLRFDWASKQAFGTAAITFSPLRELRTISLDAGMLEIQSIALPDGKALTFKYDGGDANDGLSITLDHLHAAGETLTVTIAYRTKYVNEADPNSLWGSNGKGLRFFGPTSTEPIKRRQIWSMAEPASNRYWFPSYDSPDDLRTTDVKITVEAPLMAISNGVLVDTTTNADKTRTFHWKMETPYANSLTTLAVGEYTDVQQTFDGVTLHSFGYPDEKQATADSVVRLPDTARYYSTVTGLKYPFANYSQVFAQDMPWGVSGAGTSTLTENMVDDFPTHEDYRFLWDGLSAETLARQWFGVTLTPRDWRQTWLDRGLSHYFDGLYNEQKNGRDEFLLWHMLGDHNFYLAGWKTGPRYPVVATGSEAMTDFTTGNYPYLRGALVFHMLRKHVGDDAWWRAIKLYVATNKGRTVSTDDLRRAFEETTGESLGWFFDQWVYRLGHPVFDVSKIYDASRKVLTLSVKQKQSADPNAVDPKTADPKATVEYFQGKLEIAIDGRVQNVWLDPKAENTFEFQLDAAPTIVDFDYQNTWIKEVTFAKPLDELLYQAQNDTDVMGRRFALAELTTIGKDTKTSAADKARIVTAFSDIARSSVFWRIKYNTLLQLNAVLSAGNPAGPIHLESSTIDAMLAIIRTEKSWVRSVALSILGLTADPKFAQTHVDHLRDVSHPVSYAAAIALGKSKSPKAFRALSDIMKVPSWKGENVLSGLAGLKELGDPRAVDLAMKTVTDQASHRWFLATPRWDFRIAGTETLVALGKGSLAYPVILDRFHKSMLENDVNDIFSNVLLITTIADPRSQEVFDALKARFKDDANAMSAVNAYEEQFKAAIKKP